MDSDYKLIDNPSGKNGQTKCPKCGSTDISQNTNTGKLRCNFCRFEFDPIIAEDEHDISELEGTSIYKGASNIIKDSDDTVTIKCESCGADVVIDTSTTTQARCHWCRNTLSLNNQVPNGAVPDVILPFYLDKDDAAHYIEDYVGKRKFFANTKFRKEFTTDNICGVYFPYMIIDINGHMKMYGEGEIETASYRVDKGEDDSETQYDADVYAVDREFDISIDDLCIESSTSRLDLKNEQETNNIINAVMPFDTENCVSYDSNYLRGYTSEKRDTDVSELKHISDTQGSDVARYAALETIEQYDRGVRWDYAQFTPKGDLWKAAYLPVWLYSYLEESSKGNTLHYVAVNARTAETVGSVPLNKVKLFIVSFIIELISFLLVFGNSCGKSGDGIVVSISSRISPKMILLVTGFAFYSIISARYRNKDARHKHELETSYEMYNLQAKDKYLYDITGTTKGCIDGSNARKIDFGKEDSSSTFKSFASSFSKENRDTDILINGIPLGKIKKAFKDMGRDIDKARRGDWSDDDE